MSKHLFTHFSDGALKAIDRFCDRINQSDADVFILMARKSVCFLKMLEKCGKLSEQFSKKLVVADTSVGFSSNYLLKKQICIVDDIMISGTSIAKMINCLLDIGVPASKIDVIVLAIDRKYNVMDFSDEKTGYVYFDKSCANNFDDAECIKLSNDIAQLIAMAGESYNTDFPEYNRFVLSKDCFNALFDKTLWNTINVTNVYHKKMQHI